MNVMKLMLVARAGWIHQQQEDVIDCSTAGSGLADCSTTTTAMQHETDDSNFWTLRDPADRDDPDEGEHAPSPAAPEADVLDEAI